MNRNTPEILKELMAELALTEGELSRRSDVPQPTIHRIMNGHTKDPRRSNIVKLAAALNVTSAYLLGESGENTSDQPFHMAAIGAMKGKATPHSKQIIGRIIEAVEDGRLSEEDLLLLERIAVRFDKETE